MSLRQTRLGHQLAVSCLTMRSKKTRSHGLRMSDRSVSRSRQAQKEFERITRYQNIRPNPEDQDRVLEDWGGHSPVGYFETVSRFQKKIAKYQERLAHYEERLEHSESLVEQLRRNAISDDVLIGKYLVRLERYELKLKQWKQVEVRDSLTCKFIQACEDLDLENISSCLKLGVDVNGQSENTTLRSGSALMALVSSNTVSAGVTLSQLLSREETDVNIRDQLGNTPLIKACLLGNITAVKMLSKCADIDVNLSNNFDNTALIQAVRGNHMEIVKFFLEKVPAMDWNKNSPLVDAVLEGNVELVRLFLSVPGISLAGVLRAAVEGEEGDSLGCLELLTSQPGVSWTEPDHDGVSPLAAALQSRRTEVVKLLLELPHIDTSNITEPSHIAVMRELMFSQLAELNKRLETVPECPDCLKTLERDRPVLQCLSGHLVCHSCFQHPSIQRSCPMCRSKMIGRAQGFEELLRQMF